MAKKSPNSDPPTQLLTSFLQTMQVKVNIPALKPNAKVPTLYIKYKRNGQKYSFSRPLLGDRYIIGRSRTQSDIAIRSDIVSTTHCVIEKDPQNPKQFIVKDLDSTNGIYLGRKRYQSISLTHNDTITLAPPELEDAVEIRFDNSPSKWFLLIRFFLIFILFTSVALVGFVFIEWSKYEVYPIPAHVGGKTVVYSDDGKTALAPLINAPHREFENLEDFSPYLPQALIASEDSRYNWHFGVDPLGIARALIIKRNSGVQQGASTITQQLARSIYPDVGRENNIARKLREVTVATKLEALYSKDTILKTYLNRVYLGINLYGFEDAAQFYFDKSAKDVDIAEAATLVAMLPAPNAFNPVQDYNTTLGLRNRVIERMLKLKMISEDEASRARRSTIQVSPKAKQALSQVIAPYFYSHVFQEMNDILGDNLTQEGDFIIETSLNPNIQRLAEESLKSHLDTNGRQNNFSQGAIATLNSKNGAIIALVGGKDYQQSQFNRVTQAQRQPASTFKVFVYTAALENGIRAGKTYTCSPLFWQGMQYRGCERSSGAVNMAQGLAMSENSVALRVARDVGLKKVVKTAQKLGISSPLSPVPGLALGQSEVNVLEITGAYTTFANGGVWSKPHAINVIRDGRDCENFNNHRTCREIYRFNQSGSDQKRVLQPNIAQAMNRMLQQVITAGTGRSAFLGGQGEAGKTGTNNDGKDLWFIGYAPKNNLITGVWLGNDNNKPTYSSSSQAAMLWGKYMKQVTSDK